MSVCDERTSVKAAEPATYEDMCREWPESMGVLYDFAVSPPCSSVHNSSLPVQVKEVPGMAGEKG